VPKEIGYLKQLQFLYLQKNKLTSVPKEIGNLEQLEDLRLNDNQLMSVPKEIDNFRLLRCLCLNYNKLTSVPKKIGNVENLMYLALGGFKSWQKQAVDVAYPLRTCTCVIRLSRCSADAPASVAC
jgi:Leucine-rich repeat (LRR) protein